MQKILGHSGNFLVTLEVFGTLWKIAIYSDTENLKSFRIHWKVFRHSGKFPDTLERLGIFWKVHGHFEKFPDNLINL